MKLMSSILTDPPPDLVIARVYLVLSPEYNVVPEILPVWRVAVTAVVPILAVSTKFGRA